MQSKVDPKPVFKGPSYEQGLYYGKRRLSAHQRLQILENELLDPDRNPSFERELLQEISRTSAEERRLLIAACGCS